MHQLIASIVKSNTTSWLEITNVMLFGSMNNVPRDDQIAKKYHFLLKRK